MKTLPTLTRFFSILAICGIANASQHSFYAGISSGITSLQAKATNDVSNNAPAHILLQNNKRVKTTNVSAGIYALYIFRYLNFGLGSEISFNYNNLEKNFSAQFNEVGNADNLFFKIRQRLRGNAEFSIKPGYFINDYFAHMILGVSYQNTFFDYTASGETAGATRYFHGKNRKIIRGSTIGLGIHKDLCEHIAVGLEFKATKYSARKYRFDLPHNPGQSEISLSSNLKNITTHSYCLRVMYKF